MLSILVLWKVSAFQKAKKKKKKKTGKQRTFCNFLFLYINYRSLTFTLFAYSKAYFEFWYTFSQALHQANLLCFLIINICFMHCLSKNWRLYYIWTLYINFMFVNCKLQWKALPSSNRIKLQMIKLWEILAFVSCRFFWVPLIRLFYLYDPFNSELLI